MLNFTHLFKVLILLFVSAHLAASPVSPPTPRCGAEDETEVTIVWDVVLDQNGTPITEYLVQYDGQEIPVTSTSLQGSFTARNLCPDVDVRIRVITVNPDPTCPNSSPSALSDLCFTQPCPEMNITCGAVPAGSVDQIRYDWDAVPRAELYLVSYRINGGPLVDVGSTTDLFLELDVTDGLQSGDVVEIIIAVQLEGCPACSPMQGPICAVGDCPDPIFRDPMLDFCFAEDSLQLSLPAVVDGITGDTLSGTLTWDPTAITAGINQNTGRFLPADMEQSQTYMIAFEWIDDLTFCAYRSSVTVAISILPQAEIFTIAPLCEAGEAIIEAEQVADLSATYTWEWGGGVSFTNTGPGPHQVIFSNIGQPQEVSLTVSSAAGCNDVAFAVVPIDQMYESMNLRCGAFTNSSIEWLWDELPGVNVYEVEVVSLMTGAVIESGNTLTTSASITGLTAGDEYQITVTARSNNSCPDLSESLTCVPSSCPQLAFDPAGNYDIGGFCPGESGIIQLAGSELLFPQPALGIETETWMARSPFENSVNASGQLDPNSIGALPASIIVDYQVVLVGEGCSYDTTYTIELSDAPFINSIVPDDPACVLDEVSSIEIFVEGGVEPYVIQVSNLPDVDEILSSTIFQVPMPGTYQVQITDANGCISESSVVINPADNISVELDGPVAIIEGETGTFSANYSGTIATPTNIQWIVNGNVILEGPDQDNISITADPAEFGSPFTLCVRIFFGDDCFIESSKRSVDLDISNSIENGEELSVTVFPNPFLQYLYVQGSYENLYYTILDTRGKVVKSGEVKSKLDLSHLAKGCYFFKLVTIDTGSRQVHKIIKL